MFPERWGYTNLLGIEWELATEPLFKRLAEHQSTVASLNFTLSATLFYSNISTKMEGTEEENTVCCTTSSGSCWRKLPSCFSACQGDQTMKYSRALTHTTCVTDQITLNLFSGLSVIHRAFTAASSVSAVKVHSGHLKYYDHFLYIISLFKQVL